MRPTFEDTYGVVFFLLQLPLLLLLPLGLHLHGLSDQISQDCDWFGLADEGVLNDYRSRTETHLATKVKPFKKTNAGGPLQPAITVWLSLSALDS